MSKKVKKKVLTNKTLTEGQLRLSYPHLLLRKKKKEKKERDT